MAGQTTTLYDPSALKSVTFRPLSVRVRTGPEKGKRFTVKNRHIVLGTDPELPIALTDGTVSRRHAVVEHSPKGLLIRDLDSTNGTFIKDVRVEAAYMQLPGVLRVGNTELKISFEDESVNVDLYTGEHLAGMVGQSTAMQEVFGLVARAAPTDVTVLISGESGTGKELVARALHQLSKRAEGPFVVFDCSAVPAELIESELFGHLKGAFTGASAARTGAFREAHKGTLFLDEIGELSPELQPRLLRVLESREVKPVGGERHESVDIRIVSATNRSLLSMVQNGDFREDLYYRMAHIEISLPPLRERAEDIPLLIRHFLEQSDHAGDLDVGFETMEKLIKHPWPGNIRELKNYLDRASILSQGDRIETKFLTTHGSMSSNEQMSTTQKGAAISPSEQMENLVVDYDLPFKDAKTNLVEAFEKAYWTRMLDEHRWNISGAARAAGIHRKSLEYVVKKLGLRTKDPD